MGLDKGGSCQGVAFHVDGVHRQEVIAYLRAREQATMVYKERLLRVHLAPTNHGHDHESVLAMVYCVDRGHPQYAGTLGRQEQLDIVRGAVGQSGRNPEYVVETTRALDSLGVRDATLTWLSARLQEGN